MDNKTGITYQGTEMAIVSEALPTRNGWEQFCFRPIHLNEKWIAKSSTPVSKEEILKSFLQNLSKSGKSQEEMQQEIHNEIKKKCEACKTPGCRSCSYCMIGICTNYLKNQVKLKKGE
jgi:predicted aldo/keto reductase-like oxidoreductase